MKKKILLLLILLWGNFASANCYLNIENAGNLNPKNLSSLGISLISQFVELLDSTPIYGLGVKSCMYKLVINQDSDSMIITVNGRNLNGSGNSKLRNMDGAQQAIIRAIYRGKPSQQIAICKAYGSILTEECEKKPQPIVKADMPIHRDKSVIILYDPRADAGTLPLKFSNPNEREVILTAITEINRVFLETQFNVYDQNRLEQVNQEIAKYSDYADFDQKALDLAQSNSADLLITFRNYGGEFSIVTKIHIQFNIHTFFILCEHTMGFIPWNPLQLLW